LPWSGSSGYWLCWEASGDRPEAHDLRLRFLVAIADKRSDSVVFPRLRVELVFANIGNTSPKRKRGKLLKYRLAV